MPCVSSRGFDECGGALTTEDVKAHFEEHWGAVASVTLAKYSEAFLTRHSKTSEINESLTILEARANRAQQEAREQGKQFPVFWIQDPDERFASRRTLVPPPGSGGSAPGPCAANNPLAATPAPRGLAA